MQRDATTQKLLVAGAAGVLSLAILSTRIVLLFAGAVCGFGASLLLRAPPRFEPLSIVARSEKAAQSEQPASASASTELELPEPLRQPVERLCELVIRDFVLLWYERSISLGDGRFPREARAALHAFVNALSARLARCDTREAGVYLMHSVSSALIAEMRAATTTAADDTTAAAATSPRFDVGDAQRKIRAACEELLASLAPRHATASPAASALLTEILTMVVWQVVGALDADWMNQSILMALREAPKIEAKVSEAVSVLPDADPFAIGSVAGPVEDAPSPSTGLEAPLLRARSASPSMLSPRVALKACLDGSPVAAEAALARLASEWPLDSLAVPPDPPSELVRALQGGDDLVDHFATYIDARSPVDAQRAQTLLRLYGNLDSFARHVQTADSIVRLDSYNLLQRVVDNIALDQVREPLFDATLARCLLRLDEPDALLPMRCYLLVELAADFWTPFRRRGSVSAPAPAPIPPPRADVTVSDVSDPNLAYDAQGRVKAKRQLEFVLAVERESAPGFIVARKWPELERVDAALVKAFPQAGQTPAFARAMLPNVVAKSADEVTRALEGYLTTLLNDARYAASAPVAQLFAQERTQAGAETTDALTNPLLDLGRGVGEGLAKTSTLAQRGLSLGFGALNSAVSAPLEAIGAASPVLRKRASVQFGDPTSLPYTPRKVPAAAAASADSTPATPVAPLPPTIPPAAPPAAQVAAVADVSAQLSPADLDRVLAAGIAVIEEAYTASSAWSLRRGLIRLIEAVVRTSYSATIAVACGSALAHANAAIVAASVRQLTHSFWPGGTWYEPGPPRTDEQRAATRAEARKLMLALAPDGLKVALGGAATNAAIVRFHEAVAGPDTQRWVAAVTIDLLRLVLLI